jgi:bisphosphoglycerate-dependent phosphoglycerate mutase
MAYSNIDVENFDNFSLDEYQENLTRLQIPNYGTLIGRNVYHIRPSYGVHKVIHWDPIKAEYLLDMEGDQFWSNPFRIHICN